MFFLAVSDQLSAFSREELYWFQKPEAIRTVPALAGFKKADR